MKRTAQQATSRKKDLTYPPLLITRCVVRFVADHSTTQPPNHPTTQPLDPPVTANDPTTQPSTHRANPDRTVTKRNYKPNRKTRPNPPTETSMATNNVATTIATTLARLASFFIRPRISLASTSQSPKLRMTRSPSRTVAMTMKISIKITTVKTGPCVAWVAWVDPSAIKPKNGQIAKCWEKRSRLARTDSKENLEPRAYNRTCRFYWLSCRG